MTADLGTAVLAWLVPFVVLGIAVLLIAMRRRNAQYGIRRRAMPMLEAMFRDITDFVDGIVGALGLPAAANPPTEPATEDGPPADYCLGCSEIHHRALMDFTDDGRYRCAVCRKAENPGYVAEFDVILPLLTPDDIGAVLYIEGYGYARWNGHRYTAATDVELLTKPDYLVRHPGIFATIRRIDTTRIAAAYAIPPAQINPIP